MLPEEALGALEVRCEPAHALELAPVARVAGEDEDLEARVRREEVLELERPRVGGAHEDVREHALADRQVRGVRLVRRVDDRGRRVVDADA